MLTPFDRSTIDWRDPQIARTMQQRRLSNMPMAYEPVSISRIFGGALVCVLCVAGIYAGLML